MLITNLFFKPKPKVDSNKAAIEQVVAKNAAETQVATKAELPLVDLYKDADKKDFLTRGLQYQGQILTFAWGDELPSDVYYTKSYASFPAEKVDIDTKAIQAGEPLALSASPDKATGVELPKNGTFAVQLVQSKAFDKGLEIVPATYHDGQVILPQNTKITENAIALVRSPSGSFEPAGVYIAGENHLVSLKSFLNLKNKVDLHKFSAFKRQTNEQFYVLENDSQQLVFSNIGGAIAEINLPFNNADNKVSQVYSVEFDKQLQESDSMHSRFPVQAAVGPDGKKVEPKAGGYYPLIRRNVDAQDSARYYAFNLVSSHPEVSEIPFKMTHMDKEKIVFESNQPHRKIVKTFTLDKESPYGFDLKVKVDGDNSDLWLTTGVPEVELISNMQSPVLKYRHQKGKKTEIAKQKLPKESFVSDQVTPDWVSNSNGFFTVLMNPQGDTGKGFKVSKVKSTTLPSRMNAAEADVKKLKSTDGYEFLVPLKANEKETHVKIFAGPLEKSLLMKADAKSDKPANYLGALSFQGFLSIVSEPTAKFLFIFLNLFHKITHSWGFSIILLTVLLRVILYPLNAWSIKAMRKNQEIAPEIQAIQKKYKKNPKQAQVEVMAYYKKHKVNPFTGCLPMMIQTPFFIGMFSLIRSAFVLRGVSFVPGWINNLTAPDVLFSWKTAIPFFGTQFHLLPILSCLMFFIQTKLTSPMPKDKSELTDQQKQQKMMSFLLPIMITLFCYNLPSGLNLYLISSTLLGILQQWITNRLMDKKKAKPTILKNKKTPLQEKEA